MMVRREKTTTSTRIVKDVCRDLEANPRAGRLCKRPSEVVLVDFFSSPPRVALDLGASCRRLKIRF